EIALSRAAIASLDAAISSSALETFSTSLAIVAPRSPKPAIDSLSAAISAFNSAICFSFPRAEDRAAAPTARRTATREGVVCNRRFIVSGQRGFRSETPLGQNGGLVDDVASQPEGKLQNGDRRVAALVGDRDGVVADRLQGDLGVG